MPTYTFKDNNTGITYDEFMGMNEREKYLKVISTRKRSI